MQAPGAGKSEGLTIKVLCIGDVVGKPGRAIIASALPGLVEERGIDCVIANVENAANGSGLTEALYSKFVNYGVDLMTLGDHIYKRAEILPVLQRNINIVRPANYPADSIGKEFALHTTVRGPRVAVISLMGRLFMRPPCDCPFKAAERVLARLPADVKIVLVDMHAEATSEKVAMGWHLNGLVSGVFGTHTHVPTADACVLDGGTAYITDLGMTGPYDSVLGRRKDRVLRAFTTGLPSPFDVATKDVRLCGVIVEVDADTGRAVGVEQVCVAGADSD